MAQAPVRVGFLGAGFIAAYHAGMLASVADRAPIVAVHDVDHDRATRFAERHGAVVADSADEVLGVVDAVYVATWTAAHRELVAAAADAGVAVFCEKPLATSLEDARAMVDAVETAGVVNQVGLVLRDSPSFLLLRHLAQRPEAGRLMTIVFRDDQFIPIQGLYSSTWRGDKALVGAGTLLEHSIHDVDMLRYVVGDVRRVSANQANFHGLDGIEDAVAATLAFANGATGTLATVWHDNLARPSLRRVEIFCERRYIHIEGDDWYGPVHWTDADGGEQSLEGEALAAAAVQLVDGSLNPDGEFVRAVVAARPSWPDFATAVEAHRIVEAMYVSARADGTPTVVADVQP